MNQLTVELAFGADLSASAAAWSWVDVSQDLLAQTVTIQRGRSDESSQVQPTTVSFDLDNPHGNYTPDNPRSQYHPNVRRGTPCRVSIRAGAPYLRTTGATNSRAGTPDHASLDITGDWFVAVEIEPPIELPAPGVNHELIGKFNASGNQRSLLVFVSSDGTLRIRWSTNGAAATEVDRVSTAPIPRRSRVALGVWLDVDNGSGGHTATFYAARTLADLLADPAGSLLGDPVTTTGTTSVFSGTAPLDIGDVTGSGFSPFPGRVRRAQVRSGGPTGTVVANPDFTTQTPGATSFTDSAGRPWTVTAPAEISNRQVRFVGHVDEWAPTWPYGDRSGATTPGESRVSVSAAGVLRRMGQGAKALQSTLYRRITSPQLTPNVIAYWPFEDGSEATAVASPTPGVQPLFVSETVRLGQDSSLAASKPLAQVNAGDGAGWSGVVPPATAGVWRVDMFFRVPTPAANPATLSLFAVFTTGTISQWTVEVNDTIIRVRGANKAGDQVLSAQVGPPPPDLTGWHSVSLAVDQSGANVVWTVQWIPLVGDIPLGFGSSFAGQAGRVTSVGNLFVAPSGGVSLGQLVVSTGFGLTWLSPANVGFVGETATERITRLCAEEHVPLVADSTLVDAQRVGPQRAAPLLDLLRDAAEADMGILYERRDGTGLAFRTSRSLRDQPLALELDAGSDDIVNPFEPVLDDQRLRNDITVTRDGGSSARAVDQASVDNEGRYDEEVTVKVEHDGQLADLAGWRLHLGTWPGMRYPSVSTDLVVAPHLVDDWLAVDLGDRVEVTDLPPQHPTEAVDLLVEGYSETITPSEWTAKLTCSPGGPWAVGELQVGGAPSVDMARIGSDGSALSAAVTATQTTLGVGVTAGPLWVTSASFLPFDIVVGGERMRVTQVTGTSSPQTFTVQRSLNQIVKAHGAGTTVQVARPFVLDL